MNGLDLFSGIGGISKALEEWIRPIAYCENDRYAQCVLLSRMAESDLPFAPIWDDIRTLRAGMLSGPADVIYGGFPCQDISVAGNGKGLAGERSGLFFEIMRLVREIRPSFVFLENVPAIRTRGLDAVLREFTEARYDCRWTMLSASEIGANHKRERWFLLAHSVSTDSGDRSNVEKRTDERRVSATEKSASLQSEIRKTYSSDAESSGDALADTPRQQGRRIQQPRIQPNIGNKGWWEIEPNVGRVVDGLPQRVDRLKCLGNAVVPQQAKEAFKRLMGIY